MISFRSLFLVLSLLLAASLQEAAAATCNPTGVSKNGNTYHFARLVTDHQGNIMDANNPGCVIKLLGFNMG